MNNIFVKTYEIRGSEIDSNYLLKHESLIAYYENSFAHTCADHKLAAYDLYAEKKTWIITDFYMDFSTPLPRWRDNVLTHNWIQEIKGLRTIRNFIAWYNHTMIARAIGIWIIIDVETRRPAIIDSIHQRFEINHQACIPNFNFEKIPDPVNCEYHTYSFKVGWNDIDFNHHLNSVHYFRQCIESIHYELFNNQTLQSVQMKFLREAHINDTITVKFIKDNNTYYHYLFNGNDEIFRMRSLWAD